MTTKLHYTCISDTKAVAYLEINFKAICKIEDLSFGEQRLETENFAQFSLQTDTNIFLFLQLLQLSYNLGGPSAVYPCPINTPLCKTMQRNLLDLKRLHASESMAKMRRKIGIIMVSANFFVIQL